MSDFYSSLTTLYKKDRANVCDDIGLCIALNRTLSKDPDNVDALKKALPFMFYLEPVNYFYLLYCLIPKKAFIPKTVKTEKVEDKEDKLLDKVKQVLSWSSREFKYNRNILEKLISNNEEYWKGELGIK